MLNKFWFNPFLPFGASSCTSLGQRQSDSIRAIAEVYGVKSRSVAILDDFLLVLPRLKGETGDSALQRGRKDVKLFDSLLHKLRLPKAPEKDQKPNFSTNWFGFYYDSKTGQYGIPTAKWKKLRNFFEEAFVDEISQTLKWELQAQVLERALGKFHHVTEAWPAGRPMLYNLWKLFNTAVGFKYKTKQGKRVRVVWPEKQRVRTNLKAHESLRFWRTRLMNPRPPSRAMLRCGGKPVVTWINIFRLQQLTGPIIFLILPSIVAEYCEQELATGKDGDTKSKCTIWLELLLEGLQILDIPSNLQMVCVRSNIEKLHNIILKQLYVKDDRALCVSNEIHEQLRLMSRKKGTPKEIIKPPIELRCALVPFPSQLKESDLSVDSNHEPSLSKNLSQ